MKIKILAIVVLLCTCKAFAQNATKAELNELKAQVNELSLKLNNLESTIERVVTENVNLVEQLNVKTVTSTKDSNGITWDIVRVEPDSDNNVVVTLRITNNTGVKKDIWWHDSEVIDSNSNLTNNSYQVRGSIDGGLESGFPKNFTITIKNVPINSTYFAYIQLVYNDKLSQKRNIPVRFTGVHIPR